MVKAGLCADLYLIGPNPRAFGHGQPAAAAPENAPDTAGLA